MLQGKRHKWKGYIRKTGMIGLMMLLVLPNMLISSVSEVFADEADFDFLVVGETITIVGYLGTDMDVEIPEQIQGKDVAVIADQAFMMKPLNSVTIPRTVTTIGAGAFMGCELDSIILNEGLIEIGAMAFAGNRMEHVDIPGTVTTIAQGAFSQGNLSTLTLREGLKTIADQAFWDNEIQAVHIPEGVEVIGEKAFMDNKLEEVTLPGTITSIGDQAFLGEEGKNNIRTLILQEGLSSIGESAFKDNLLESVHIPGSVSVIEKEAFMGNAIQTLILNEGVEEIGEHAFEQNNLEEIVIPSTVNLIATRAFFQNEINTLTLPSGVGAIGDAAFALNPLTEVKVYNDELEFGMFPFMQAPPATPADITLFGRSGSTTEQYAIANGYPFQVLEESGSTVCGEHTDFECVVNDDDTVTITGYDDDATKDVVIPQLIDGKTVTAIGDEAFGSKGLTSVTIPDSVTDIGENAFTYNQLTSVTLPNSLTSIKEGTFQANQLTSVVIPDFVVDIGQRAFHDNQLTSVTIPNSVVTIGYGAFWVNQLTEITIPDSVEFIGASAFNVNELTSVTIPASVQNIREQSFGRNPLQMVQFEGAVPIFGANPFATPLLDANFEGWYTDENFENAWDNTVPSPMIIYGKWKEDCGEEGCLELNLTPSETNPTNQDVTISVNVNRLPESIRELKWAKGDQSLAYFQAGGGELVTSNEFIVSENETYTVYVEDVLGRELIATIQIHNIDKTPPVVTGVTDGEVYNAPVTISFNEGTATLNGIAFTSGTTVSANGEYELIVTDEAGNETTVIFEMNQSDYIYVNNGSGTVRITGYRGNDTSIEIPDTLDGQTVAAIGNYAFSEKNLESVIIPDSVTSIGEYAFFENRLQEIEIPGSVITIGNHAFRDNNLASVTFSEGLERIGGNAFSNNHITELTIPDTVTLIDYGAFVGNNLTELTLGENVQTIEAAAFWLNNLQSVTIPESVRSIGRSAFSNNQIKEFIVLSNQVNINPNVFHDLNPANPEQLTIHGYCGSTANELAKHWGYSFEQLEADECLMITLTPSGTEPTNEDVTVLIDVISDIANVVELKWAKGSKDLVDFQDGDGEDVTDNQFTLSENGTYTVYVKDKTGNEKVERIEINNIDKSLLIIHVQIVDGDTITLHVYGSDSIQQLKQKIQDAVGIAPENQKITFGGNELEDGRTIADYNILNDATLQLEVISPGGGEIPTPPRLKQLGVSLQGERALELIPTSFDHDIGNTKQETIEIFATANDPKAKITLNGAPFDEKQSLPLNEGKNLFTIIVTAENGDEQIYTITVTRQAKEPSPGEGEHIPSNDNSLELLEAYVDGENRLLFDPTQFEYNLGVTEAAAVEIVAKPRHPKAKITLDGEVLEDRKTLLLEKGEHTFDIIVTAENGDEQIYTITVTRQAKASSPGRGWGFYIPSSDKSIDQLEAHVDGKNILPFDPAQFEYDLGDTEAETVEIIVKTHHPKAKITLDGEAFVDKKTLLLKEGNNIFDIVIIAENGSEQAYTLILNQLEKVRFTDIAGHWGEGYIKKSYWEKLFYGYPDRTFRPDDRISRMEVTSLSVRLLELDEQKQVPFTDVQSIGKDVMEELEKAYANGVVKGYPDQTFKPAADVTRAHLALIFYRTYEKVNGAPYQPKQLEYFPDIAGSDQETQNAIAMLVELNIAEGYGGNFMPDDQATRAQAAKMFVKFKEVLGRLENK